MAKEQMTEETKAFLNEREERFGGKITWRGFSLFYGDSNGNIREKGVFVFKIGKIFHFEDFEVTQKFLGLPIFNKKSDAESKYVKFEGSFDPSEITNSYYVKRSDAVLFVNGKSPKAKPVSKLSRFFKEVVLAFEFENGSVKYFEVAGKEFLSLINSERKK